MQRTEKGQFTDKFLGEPKVLRSIRLTEFAWNKLKEISSKFSLTRTDFIELLTRKYKTDEEAILDALDRFTESQQHTAKGNQHKRKGEAVDINTSRDWTKLREFRLWVQSQIQELE